MDFYKNRFEFASSLILQKRPSGGASPLRTTVTSILAGAFFFFLKVTFALKHVFWWFLIKMTLKWYQNHELLQEMASWTLWNLGGYPKCLKWSSQSRPVAKRVPMRLQEVSWSEKWATSQLECKSSIKMLILLCVLEGPSQIHRYLQAKLLPHSVHVAKHTRRPLYQHR